MQWQYAGIVLLLLIWVSPLAADIGLPMIFVVWPAFFLAFIPIILIEWLVLRNYCTQKLEISGSRSLYAVSIANLVSMLIGIPVAWIIVAALEIVGMHFWGRQLDMLFSSLHTTLGRLPETLLTAPWLLPYEEPQMRWMIPAAFMVLLVPFFLISYWIEAPIVQRILRASRDDSRILLRKGMWKANLCSYLFLFFVALCLLLYQLKR